MKTDVPISCGAWIEVPTAEGRRKTCVLAAGHYLEKGPGGGSWHTDCPEKAGKETHNDLPLCDHVNYMCAVWSDNADGAHPSDVALGVTPKVAPRCLSDLCSNQEPHQHGDTCGPWCTCEPGSVTPEPVTPQKAHCSAKLCNNREPHQHGDACGSWCPCKSTTAESDPTVKQSGRTLGTNIVGGYRADVKIGDASMSTYGPAKFVANMLRTFADAFEEEAER